ncbi:MAG TPA: hypothetical protein VFM93_10420 [Candidatus Limnocylindria bacterium]|nr:hypothetical protein [Candidatus Limnocylindria bacterium]
MQEKKEQGQPKGGTGSSPEIGKQGGDVGKQGDLGKHGDFEKKGAGTPTPGQGTGQQR